MPALSYDLVIFDCDGVLVDSETLSCDCLRRLLGQFGYEIALDDVFERFLGRSFSVVEKEYELALKRPLSPAFVEAHRSALRACFAAGLKPVPNVECVLDEMVTPFCVASSSDLDRLRFSLRLTGLAGRFGEHVYSADQVRNGKPAPDLFLHAASAMSASPSRSLVLEDSVNGVRAGKAAGMTVWGFIGGSHYAGRDGARMLADAGADRVISDVLELSGF